jgi:hypothetical protein
LGRGLIGVKKTMQIYGFFVLSPVGVDTCYLAVLGYFFKKNILNDKNKEENK